MQDKNVTIFFIIACVCAYLCLCHIFMRQIQRIIDKENPKHIRVRIILRAVISPVKLGLFSAPITPICLYLNQESVFRLVDLTTTLGLAYLAFFCWLLHRVINETARYFIENPKYDSTTASALSKLSKVILYSVALLLGLSLLGVDANAVITFSGASGLMIGYAAKDVISNFFGALIIHLDSKLRVGDWVSSPEMDLEGVVREINFRCVTIERFDRYPIFIPCGTFISIAIANHSMMSHRRLNERIGIRIVDASVLRQITTLIDDYINNAIVLDQKQSNFAYLDSINASSLAIWLNVYCRTTDWIHFQKVKQDILLDVIAIIKENGGELAHDVVELHKPSHSDSL